MKVLVTHLKAPWPAGTKPGNVVDFGDSVTKIPPWALGKCQEFLGSGVVIKATDDDVADVAATKSKA